MTDKELIDGIAKEVMEWHKVTGAWDGDSTLSTYWCDVDEMPWVNCDTFDPIHKSCDMNDIMGAIYRREDTANLRRAMLVALLEQLT